MPAAKSSSVWGRGIRASWRGVSPAEVSKLLSLRLDATDLNRMEQLGVRAQTGKLNDVERAELDELVSVGQVITLLQSLARQHGIDQPALPHDAGSPSTKRRRRAS